MNKDKKIASKIRMRCRCTQFLMFFNINSQNLAYCSEVGERIKIIQTRKKRNPKLPICRWQTPETSSEVPIRNLLDVISREQHFAPLFNKETRWQSVGFCQGCLLRMSKPLVWTLGLKKKKWMYLLFLKKSGERKIIVNHSRIPIHTHPHLLFMFILILFIFICELGSCYVTQDILEFLGPQNPLTSVSWVTGTSM